MTAEVRHTTGIQWTHVPGYIGATWNPSVGCTRVSPGCDHCYAFTLHDQRYKANLDVARMSATRMQRMNSVARMRELGAVLPMPPQYDVPFSTVQMLDEKRLTAPLRAKAPHAYFVDSMADLFHEDVTDEFLDRVFLVMATAPRHIFMVLTKRPERMRAYVTAMATRAADRSPIRPWPLPNVWLGVSAENQEWADKRIPWLLGTPAAVRFVSYEPALGLVDFAPWLPQPARDEFHPGVLGGASTGFHSPATRGLDWIIVGGESGQRARPFALEWARSAVAQAHEAGARAFVKQLGAQPEQGGMSWGPYGLKLKNRHGSDPAEWPEDLKIREWPAVQR